MLYNNLIDLRTITFITKKKVIVFYGFILYELSCAFIIIIDTNILSFVDCKILSINKKVQLVKWPKAYKQILIEKFSTIKWMLLTIS